MPENASCAIQMRNAASPRRAGKNRHPQNYRCRTARPDRQCAQRHRSPRQQAETHHAADVLCLWPAWVRDHSAARARAVLLQGSGTARSLTSCGCRRRNSTWGCDDANVRMPAEGPPAFFQPAGRDHRVIIEQDHAVAFRHGQTLIVAARQNPGRYLRFVITTTLLLLLRQRTKISPLYPSVDALSTRINSCGSGVRARMLSRQSHVCSSWLCVRMMIETMGAWLDWVSRQLRTAKLPVEAVCEFDSAYRQPYWL